MLYLVATPIGNLADISFRAVEILKKCDYILCEDTRHSHILLSHYEVGKPLKSFHKFNEASKEDFVIQDLHAGKDIALISDAGTPGIADPGMRIVETCIQEGIPVTSIPGACAALLALTLSGFPTEPFQFQGFLPRKEGELRRLFAEVLAFRGTSIFYESANRIIKSLSCLAAMSPDRPIVVARELTKKFEEIHHGTTSKQVEYWRTHPPKGEIVILISPAEESSWEQLSPLEHIAFLEENYGLSRKEALKLAAELRGVPKRELYKIK